MSETELEVTHPHWITDTVMAERVMDVFRSSMQNAAPLETAKRLGISVSTYYEDLTRARDFFEIVFADDLAHITMEQVNGHREAIRNLYVGFNALIAQNASPRRAMAIARLSREISVHMAAIEEIVGLRRKGRAVPLPPVDTEARSGMLIVDSHGRPLEDGE